MTVFKLAFLTLLCFFVSCKKNVNKPIEVQVTKVCYDKDISKTGQLEKTLVLKVNVKNNTSSSIRTFGKHRNIEPIKVKIKETSQKWSLLLIDNSNTVSFKPNSSADCSSNLLINFKDIDEVILYWDFYFEQKGQRILFSDSSKIMLNNIFDCE